MTQVDLSALPPLPEGEVTRHLDEKQVAAELTYFVEDAIHSAPRSLQRALGPSELGIECARRIGYRLADVEPINHSDGWLAFIGTAVHASLERVFTRANQRLQHPRFVCEQRVTVGTLAGEPVVGATDLYDRACAWTVDFKVMGKTSLQRLARHGPGSQYRAQAHLYARGWIAAGHPVDRVAVWGLPRNEPLSRAVFWSEPYDEQVAVESLTRAEGIASLVSSMGVGALSILPTADSYCGYCPFFRRGSTDLATGCPGHPTSRAAGPTDVESLIAPPTPASPAPPAGDPCRYWTGDRTCGARPARLYPAGRRCDHHAPTPLHDAKGDEE
ncbi:hypothetical protein GCM10009799_20390 [Nocardiopsis rhodophaea]|uniref:PD-(D/E)XK endonuclease-like domain-containing protein n=1 Tax=Nocardiopsis rhodophaea TaxID=280238 RepID=A0ABP5EEE7_9ACTN